MAVFIRQNLAEIGDSHYTAVESSVHGFVRVDSVMNPKSENFRAYYFCRFNDVGCIVMVSGAKERRAFYDAKASEILLEIESKRNEANKMQEPTPNGAAQR